MANHRTGNGHPAGWVVPGSTASALSMAPRAIRNAAVAVESRPFMATTRAWRSRCRSCAASDGFDVTKRLLNQRGRGRNLVSLRTGQIRRYPESDRTRQPPPSLRRSCSDAYDHSDNDESECDGREESNHAGSGTHGFLHRTGWSSPNLGNNCELWTSRRTMSIDST